MIHFTAKNITVLRLTKKMDSQGQIISPECHIIIPDHPVPVHFEGKVVGLAQVKRKKSQLVANIQIQSKMNNGVEALRLMRLLFPSIQGKIIDAYEHTIIGLEVTGIGLSGGKNVDPKIEALGDKVSCDTAKKDLH